MVHRRLSAGSPATATFSTGPWPMASTHADVRRRAELIHHSRFLNVIDKHKVQYFLHTAPNPIRALMQAGDEPVRKNLAQDLRLRARRRADQIRKPGVVSHRVVGRRATASIVDTWWQTENRLLLITDRSPAPHNSSPVRRPNRSFLGVCPKIVDADGKVLSGEAQG